MGLISTSNYRVGKEYVFNITVGSNLTLADKKVVVLEKGYKKLLLKIDGKEQWFTNEQLSTKRSDKKVFKRVSAEQLRNKTIAVENIQVPSVVVSRKVVEKPKSIAFIKASEDVKRKPLVNDLDDKALLDFGKQTHGFKKITHSSVVPRGTLTTEKKNHLYALWMARLRETLLSHNYTNVYSLKPSELINLIDKNISDFVK